MTAWTASPHSGLAISLRGVTKWGALSFVTAMLSRRSGYSNASAER